MSICNEKKGEKTLREFAQHEKEDFSNQEDFYCPICWSLLYEPVTLPCNHNLCYICFVKNLDEVALNCPCCRMRISNWTRIRSKEKNLVNIEFWTKIKNAFPKIIEERLVEILEIDENYISPLEDLIEETEQLKDNFHEEQVQNLKDAHQDSDLELNSSVIPVVIKKKKKPKQRTKQKTYNIESQFHHHQVVSKIEHIIFVDTKKFESSSSSFEYNEKDPLDLSSHSSPNKSFNFLQKFGLTHADAETTENIKRKNKELINKFLNINNKKCKTAEKENDLLKYLISSTPNSSPEKSTNFQENLIRSSTEKDENIQDKIICSSPDLPPPKLFLENNSNSQKYLISSTSEKKDPPLLNLEIDAVIFPLPALPSSSSAKDNDKDDILDFNNPKYFDDEDDPHLDFKLLLKDTVELMEFQEDLVLRIQREEQEKRDHLLAKALEKSFVDLRTKQSDNKYSLRSWK